MKQEIILTTGEVELLKKTLNERDTVVTSIEKNAAEFRIHYKRCGGIGSCAIVYSLTLSMVKTMASIKKLEKEILAK